MQHIPECVRPWYPPHPEKPDYEKMAQQCMDALETYPEEREYLLAYAAVYLRFCGKIEESIEHCRKYLPTLTNKECIDDMRQCLKYCLEEKGDVAAAIQVLEEEIPQNENPYHLYNDLVELCAKAKDHDKTIQYGLLAIKEGLCESEVYTWVAEAYEAKKDYLNSHEYLVKAAQSEPDNTSWIWNNAGRALALAGQLDEAMFYFKMVLKMNPEQEMAHYYMGQAYQDKEDVYRALHHYTEALKIRPDFPEVYNNLAAISYYENSNINEAIANLEKALEANPDSSMLVKLYMNLSRLYKSIADYERHEYYKARLMDAMGFSGLFGDGDLDDLEDEDDFEPN